MKTNFFSRYRSRQNSLRMPLARMVRHLGTKFGGGGGVGVKGPVLAFQAPMAKFAFRFSGEVFPHYDYHYYYGTLKPRGYDKLYGGNEMRDALQCA